MISSKHIKLLLVLILLPFKVGAYIENNSGTSVGTLDGQFSVNEMGAAVYSVPINLFPSGTGFDPQIGIVYNSQLSGYGNVGYGVNITGLSSITRAGKDLFHDKKVEKIKYSKGDTYLLNGKRLILKSGTYGYNNATYTVEGNPYVTVKQIGDDERSTTSFIYTDANGTTYEYRETQLVPIGNDIRTITWYISKATNKYGDCIEYKYMTDNRVLYPSEITYGRNGERHKVCFIYAALSKAEKFHFEGGWEGYINRRLTRITSYNGNSIYRRYDFTYNNSSNKPEDDSARKFDRLTSISVYNNANEALEPLTFNWKHLKAASMVSSNCSVNTFSRYFDNNGNNNNTQYDDDDDIGTLTSADLNGDGISDIVRISRGQHKDGTGRQYTFVYVCRSKIDAQGKVTYPDTLRYDLPAAFTMRDLWNRVTSTNSLNGGCSADIDGDGLNDFVMPFYENNKNYSGAILSFYYILGKNIVKKKTNWKPTENIVQHILKTKGDYAPHLVMDFDGDGKADILYVEDKRYNSVYFGKIVTDICGSRKSQEIRFTYPDNKTIKRMYSADCNADGFADVILIFDNGYKIYYNNGVSYLSGVFSESNSKTMQNSELKDYWRMEQGDFDGDGLLDFVYSTDWKLTFLRNNGNGTFSNTGSTKVDFVKKDTDKDKEYFAIRIADFDKDGRSDLIVSKKDLEWHGGFKQKYSYKQTQVRWFVSDGNKPVLFSSVDKTRDGADSYEPYIFTGDFDGDGYAEIANYGSPLNSATNNTFQKNNINIYKFSTDVSLGRISSIKNGYGKTTTITYSVGTDSKVYEAGDRKDDAYPVNTYSMPLPLVSKVVQTNGAAGSNTVSYTYGGLKAHIRGRGMLGFSSTTVNNITLGSKTETKVTEWDYQKDNQTDNYKYIPTSVLSTTIIGGKTSKNLVTNDKIIQPEWNGNYFSYCKEKLSTDFDNHQIKTQYTYDLAKGVLKNEKSYYDGRTDMYKQTRYSGFYLYAGKYLPHSVMYFQRHSDDREYYEVDHSYTYDDNGDVKEDVQTSRYKDQTIKLTTQYTRDAYGNILKEKTSGLNVVEVEKCYEYDTNHLRLVKSYTDPTSVVITYKYDSWGNLITKSDESCASNILSTTYTYDKWGALVKTVNPDGTYTSTATTWDTTPTTDGSKYGSVYKTVTTATAQPPVTVYYDSEGREVNSSTIGLKGVNISKVTHYDSKGNVAHVVNTTGELEKTSVFSYDAFGRITSLTNSDGSSVENSYNDRTVTIKNPTGTRTKTYDAWGNIKEVNDALGNIITYHYNSNGQPSAISTNNSSSVTFDYDAAGRRIYMKDPDAGEMKYTFAADGTPLSQTDARGVRTRYSYDNLGRLKTKTYVDKSGNKKTQTNEYFPSGKDINRLKSQTYDGYKRTFTYDTYGRVTSETRNMSISYGDSKDKRTSYTTKWTYNSKSQKQSVTYPSSSANMTFSYSYDQYGYLNEIKHDNYSVYSVKSYNGLTLETNTVAGVLSKTVDKDGYPSLYQLSGKDSQTFSYNKTTGNLEGRKWTHGVTTMLDESFKYDNLDRLESVSGTQKMTMSYAKNGNILSKTGIGTYTYDVATSKKPHAVTSVSNDSKIITSNMVGTEFGLNGKINTIGCNGAYRAYHYGPDDEKWMTYGWGPTQPGENDVEHLYFGNYEEITEDDGFTEYYFLENDVIVIQKTKGDKTLTHELGYYQGVTDNLGNVLMVYDNKKREAFKAKYDAWGKQTVYTNTINLQYGYTGHEMLPDFDLIDMIGRLYDPNLGRFISCDNYVQMPDNSQNFNRYSYCLNNPLRYTDPSGEAFGVDDAIIIGIIVGSGALNLAANWDNCHDFWQGACYFLNGVGSAAVTMYEGPIVGGACLGGVNSIITQGWEKGAGHIDYTQVAMDATMGGVIGGVSSAAGDFANSFIGSYFGTSFDKIANVTLRETLKGAAGGLIAGSSMGSLMYFCNGATGSFWNNFLMNAAIGVTLGAAGGYAKGYELQSQIKKEQILAEAAPAPNKPDTNNSTCTDLAPYYPPNDGAAGQWETYTLKPGYRFSRIGDKNGKYASPEGTPFEARSLPPSAKSLPNYIYEVQRPITVQKSYIAPWFCQPGGGIQYKFPQSIKIMWGNGDIIRIVK